MCTTPQAWHLHAPNWTLELAKSYSCQTNTSIAYLSVRLAAVILYHAAQVFELCDVIVGLLVVLEQPWEVWGRRGRGSMGPGGGTLVYTRTTHSVPSQLSSLPPPPPTHPPTHSPFINQGQGLSITCFMPPLPPLQALWIGIQAAAAGCSSKASLPLL